MMLSMYLLLALTGFEPESNPFQNTQRSVLLCESLRLNYADRYNISARALRAFRVSHGGVAFEMCEPKDIHASTRAHEHRHSCPQ